MTTSPDRSDRPLRLHRRLYPARAVREAIKAFSEVATVELSREDDYHVVRLQPTGSDLDAETLRWELANYALSRAARSR